MRTVSALPNSTGANPLVILPGIPTTSGVGVDVDVDAVIGQMLRRACSPGFDDWWRRAESVGFCAHPIQLAGTDAFGRKQIVWTRCNNRRAHICPSCSDLYARDTWQLVHAGAAGGHHNIPTTVSEHPQVFATLTAASFGPVHNATGAVCHDQHRQPGRYQQCEHGNPLWCSRTHEHADPLVGQPLCSHCYDYLSHVLFTWHLPELWRRFTITLRRAVRRELKIRGHEPDSVRVSFVKVVEMQARAVPHIHALIRLDPAEDTQGDRDGHGPAASGGGEPRNASQPGWGPPLTAPELAVLIDRVARQISVTVPDPRQDGNPDDPPAASATEAGVVVVRFGTQIDTQPLGTEPSAAQDDSATVAPGGLTARRVARYLAKYVTKSLHDFGIAARRLSAESIASLDVSEHVRAILSTIASLAGASTNTQAGGGNARALAGIGRWLHTLGYRGHITTKSRRYSTTMGALRAARAEWTHRQNTKDSGTHHDWEIDRAMIDWAFDRAGHATTGDQVLAVSASLRHTARRLAGLDQRHQGPDNDPSAVPDG